jgi:hypothetical protein
VSVAAVDASSNRSCVTCPTVTTVYDVRVSVANVDTNKNRACDTCPTVATGETHPLLLGHHGRDRIATIDYLSVATESYRPLVQKHIDIVVVTVTNTLPRCVEDLKY